MNKLVEIKGFWNMSGDYDFNEKDMWEGKLLLEEDGWFEGIVTDPRSPYTGDRMIFGILHPDKIIELIKVSPTNVSDPFVFRGQKYVNGYDGEFSAIGLFDEQYCGVFHIITKEVELKDENDKEELLSRIAKFKDNGFYSMLYENTLRIRDRLSKYVLGKYIGEDNQEKDSEKKLVKDNKPVFFDDDII